MDSQKMRPEKFFYSHCSSDIELVENIKKAFEKYSSDYSLYMAERQYVGFPLIEKLRDELYDSNAMIISWTETAHQKSNEIISFEMGMAYALRIPIFLLLFCKEKPWFFDKVTDYISVNSISETDVLSAIQQIDLYSFIHPIDLYIPKEPLYKNGVDNHSRNLDVVNIDGTILMREGFDGIIHFVLKNNRNKPENNVHVILEFPPELELKFHPGSLEHGSKIQRNEIFYMRQTAKNKIEINWPSLPIRNRIFEVRVSLPKLHQESMTKISFLVSSEHITFWRMKEFAVQLKK